MDMNLVEALSKLGEAEFNAVAQLVTKEKQRRDDIFNKQKIEDWKRVVLTMQEFEKKYGSFRLEVADFDGFDDYLCDKLVFCNKIDDAEDEVGTISFELA